MNLCPLCARPVLNTRRTLCSNHPLRRDTYKSWKLVIQRQMSPTHTWLVTARRKVGTVTTLVNAEGATEAEAEKAIRDKLDRR